MKLHKARRIARQSRMFMNGWTWSVEGTSPPSRRVLEARRILRRRYRTPIESETHVLYDGQLLDITGGDQQVLSDVKSIRSSGIPRRPTHPKREI